MSDTKTITCVNNSTTTLIFSCFNAGDDGIPFSTTTVGGGGKGILQTGDFTELGIGVQAQAAGVWLEGTPKNKPYAKPGQTVTFTMNKVVS